MIKPSKPKEKKNNLFPTLNTGLFVSIKLEESFVFYFELAFSIN